MCLGVYWERDLDLGEQVATRENVSCFVVSRIRMIKGNEREEHMACSHSTQGWETILVLGIGESIRQRSQGDSKP